MEHASDWPEDFSHFTHVYFPATEICAVPCCQCTSWGHLPQLSARFEPWMKHLSVLDMKQQYILEQILLRGITLLSTGIIEQISCLIVELLLYVAYLSSCFGNFKMVTECDLSRAMLPIYYATSFLTFCQISGLKEAFEKTNKH